MTLIDTAEMYANGGAEELVGEAISGRREECSWSARCCRITPRAAAPLPRASQPEAASHRPPRSLPAPLARRIALAETLEAFDAHSITGRSGTGASATSTSRTWRSSSRRRRGSRRDQSGLYNLARRGIEFDLLPWCRARRIPVMAHPRRSNKGGCRQSQLHRVASRQDATPAQIALAWVLRQPDVIAIPKAATLDHVRENREALEII